jgi:hypothetical protein
MIRPIAKIAAAILLTQPSLPEHRADSYAKVIDREAREHYFDPYTMVSMAFYESSWRQGVGDGRCWGLMGVCTTNYRVCQREPKGAACQSKKAMLLNGHENLRVAADLITANRQFCRTKTGRAKFHHWLASYQGANKPNRGVWCGQKKVRGRWVDVPKHPYTARVMSKRRWLIRKLN